MNTQNTQNQTENTAQEPETVFVPKSTKTVIAAKIAGIVIAVVSAAAAGFVAASKFKQQ
jgi:hypothetical protein